MRSPRFLVQTAMHHWLVVVVFFFLARNRVIYFDKEMLHYTAVFIHQLLTRLVTIITDCVDAVRTCESLHLSLDPVLQINRVEPVGAILYSIYQSSILRIADLDFCSSKAIQYNTLDETLTQLFFSFHFAQSSSPRKLINVEHWRRCHEKEL